MTKSDIIAAASYDKHGGYVNTGCEWCMCSTPEKLADYIRSLGFVVIDYYETSYSSGIVITEDGYKVSYIGHCVKLSNINDKPKI